MAPMSLEDFKLRIFAWVLPCGGEYAWS